VDFQVAGDSSTKPFRIVLTKEQIETLRRAGKKP
jgi:hypothetical protein